MKEIWKPVPDFERHYLVSNRGRFKSLGGRIGNWKERILKPKVMKDGYLYIRMNSSNGQELFNAHRMVARVFLPNPENKKEVNHKNLKKDDNKVSNLEWVTPQENQRHAVLLRGEWRGGGRCGGSSKYPIPNYVPGMSSTKEGKKEYMKHYHQLRRQQNAIL